MQLANKHTKANLILSSFFVCAMMVFLYSCGSGGSGDGSAGTGSVSFSLALRDSATSGASNNRQLDDDTSPFECETDTYRITAIEAEVVDVSEELLAEGGPFDCEDRQGDIGDVEAGGGRVVKVFAIGESGELVAEGESGPVTVIAGQTVDAGKIVLKLENSAPLADAGPAQTPFVGDTVTLDGSGSSDVDGDLLSFSWSFVSLPPGSQAALSNPAAVNPTFNVDVRDTYVVQLIVNDGTVDSDPDTVIIDTENSAPVADAGTDQPMPNVGDTVNLDGSGSFDVDDDILSYSWSFTSLPLGSEAELSDPTAANPTFDVDVRDTYVAQLIVNDGTVDSEPSTVAINVQNTAPVADAEADQLMPFVGDTVNLDGSGSFDVDDDILNYFWSFTSLPPNSEAELSDPTAANPTFDVDLRDIYVAQLIVNDGTVDSAPETVTINVLNRVPLADAGPDQTTIVTLDPDAAGPTLQEPILVNLDGSASSDQDGDGLSYSWSLERPAGSTAVLSDPSAVRPIFVADLLGTYVVQLIVNDGTNNSLPDSAEINFNLPSVN
jgi:hypothetical protein